MNLAPPMPDLATPTHGQIVRSPTGTNVMAVQNVTDADGDAVEFIFDAYYYDSTFTDTRKRVGRRGDVFAPVPQDTTRSQTVWTTMPDLIENTHIWWRARTTDGLEQSEWSAPRMFILDTYDDAPTPFNLVRPRPSWELDTTRTTRPRFEWEHTYDPDAGQDVTFILRYGNTPNLADGGPGVQKSACRRATSGRSTT